MHNLGVQRYGANLHIDCHMQIPYYLAGKGSRRNPRGGGVDLGSAIRLWRSRCSCTLTRALSLPALCATCRLPRAPPCFRARGSVGHPQRGEKRADQLTVI
ncbi:MAG: hypothetical protein WKG07_44095 [Hymenobacter sp.]